MICLAWKLWSGASNPRQDGQYFRSAGFLITHNDNVYVTVSCSSFGKSPMFTDRSFYYLRLHGDVNFSFDSELRRVYEKSCETYVSLSNLEL